jgi:hypothetical protein
MPDRRVSNAKRPGELRSIPCLTMVMSKHCPEAMHGSRSNGDSQLRQIPFQKGADESSPPVKTIIMRAGQKGPWKSSSEPEFLVIENADFIQ